MSNNNNNGAGRGRRRSLLSLASTEAAESSQRLIINNRCLAAMDVRCLRQHCRQTSQKVSRFGLVYCYLVTPRDHVGCTVLNEVVALLRENPQLTSVTLKGPFPRHKSDMDRLLHSMQKFARLRDIAVGAWYLSQHHVPFDRAWISLIQSNQQLERLSLDSFDLGSTETSIETMVEALSHAPNLQSLGLRNCRISDDGLCRIVEGLILPHLKSLDTLQLACNTTLTPQALASVATLIESSTSLKFLDLVGNKTCFVRESVDDGAAAQLFLDALGKNATLLNLSLIYCEIKESFGAPLFEALESNQSLQLLELDYNQLTRAFLGRHCLKRLPSLNVSHLGVCGLKTKHVDADTGQDVLVDWRCQGDGQCDAIRRALTQNSKVVSMNLDCSCCRKQCRPILQRNRIWQTVDKLRNVAPLSLHPIWIAACNEKRTWHGDDKTLHWSSVFGFLQSKADQWG